jgi:hypothetical protein
MNWEKGFIGIARDCEVIGEMLRVLLVLLGTVEEGFSKSQDLRKGDHPYPSQLQELLV